MLTEQQKEALKWFQDRPEEYLKPYQELFTKINAVLKNKTPFSAKVSNGFHFHVNKDSYELEVPPYFKMYEPPFAHYLVHARMLEDGWPQIDIEYGLTDEAYKDSLTTKEEFESQSNETKEAIYFNWQNRSADSFFDTYVWIYLSKFVDKNYFLEFTKGTIEQTEEDILKGFQKLFQTKKFKYNNWMMVLDWFVMFWTVSGFVDKNRQTELEQLWQKAKSNKEIVELLPEKSIEKVETLRKFYEDLLKNFPTHKDLIKDKKQMQKLFEEYYYTVWEGTGFRVKVKSLI